MSRAAVPQSPLIFPNARAFKRRRRNPQEEQPGALVGTELEGVYDTEIMVEVIYVYIYIHIYIYSTSPILRLISGGI